MSDEYDNDSQYSEEVSPPPRRKRSPRLDEEDDRPSPQQAAPRRKRSVRLDDGEEPQAPTPKAPRKAAQPAKKSATPAKAPKQPPRPVDRGKWRNATLRERATRIRWIGGLLYRYSPVILILLILVAFFGPRIMQTVRLGFNPPLIAPFYTQEVQHWAPQISKWSTEYDVNPNLIATLMQIESCGYPGAESVVGAQGLFQVMPMNFSADTTNMTDPETNAEAGITVIRDCLRYADGDVGLAMACYNGGPSLISRDRFSWPEESQKYYIWGTGIYNDAVRGMDKSDTLNNWLQSGGVYLCRKAAQSLGIATAQFTEAAPTAGLPEPPTVELSNSDATSPFRPTGTPLTAVPTIQIQIPPTATSSVKLFLTPTLP